MRMFFSIYAAHPKDTKLCLLAEFHSSRYKRTMRIVMFGMGNVGGALARLWSAAGYDVTAAAREDRRGSAAGAGVIALCLPWSAAESVLASCGDLTGKVLIDCTNPVTPSVDALAIGGVTSAAERIQALHPGASVVKAFNSLGAALLGDADFNGEAADGFFCGDNASAKRAVEPLVAAAGLHPVDVGPLRNARYLEALAMLWIDLAIHRGRGPTFAFKMLTRAAEVPQR